MWPCRLEWPMACLTRGAGKELHGMLQAKPCRTAATLTVLSSLPILHRQNFIVPG